MLLIRASQDPSYTKRKTNLRWKELFFPPLLKLLRSYHKDKKVLSTTSEDLNICKTVKLLFQVSDLKDSFFSSRILALCGSEQG